MHKLLTFWATTIFVIFVALQWFPLTGVFLMMLAAPFWVGFMPHIIAGAFVIDVLNQKIPRILILIPIFPYILYYGFFVNEQIYLSQLEAHLRANNPSEILQYDSNIHDLVMQNESVSAYKIPVSYSENSNFPEGYFSHRLVSLMLGQEARGARDWLQLSGVSWYDFSSGRYSSRDFPNVSKLAMPEQPTKKLLQVGESAIKDENDSKLTLRRYVFSMDGERLGEFISASYAAMPILPQLIIGCALNSARPAWVCWHQISYKERELNTFSSDDGADKYGDWPVSRMLKIEKYTDNDLKNFKDYPETVELLKALMKKKKNEKPEDFNEWGISKDSLYMPKISDVNGIQRFEGAVYQGDKGGPFYSFIKKNEGKIVYLDIQVNANANARYDSFTNWGVCKNRENCTTRTDNSYYFKNSDGAPHRFDKEGEFKGFFMVGKEELFINEYNKGDHDTRTELIFLSPEDIKKQNKN